MKIPEEEYLKLKKTYSPEMASWLQNFWEDVKREGARVRQGKKETDVVKVDEEVEKVIRGTWDNEAYRVVNVINGYEETKRPGLVKKKKS